MKIVKSSTVPVGIGALIAAVIFGVCNALAFYGTACQMMLIPMEILSAGVFTVIGLAMMRTLYLTPEGIRHCWFRYCYKVTLWCDIADISRVYMGRRWEKQGATLWVTCKNANVLKIVDYGIPKISMRSELRRLRGDYFTLLNAPEIVECIEKYYGKLDYDYLAHK